MAILYMTTWPNLKKLNCWLVLRIAGVKMTRPKKMIPKGQVKP